MRGRAGQQTDKLLADRHMQANENGDANELANDVYAFLHGQRAGAWSRGLDRHESQRQARTSRSLS